MRVLIGMFIILLQGCTALHVPQSEVFLFEGETTTQKTFQGLSVNSSIININLRNYAIREHLKEGATRKLARRNFYGMSWTFLANDGKFGALGIAAGSGVFGLDYSYSFSEKVFMTLYGNGARNFGGVLQTPIYRGKRSGLGLGVFYRNERHGLKESCSSYFCLGLGIGSAFRVTAIGIRAAQYVETEKGRFRVRLSLGYSPELKGVVFIGSVLSAP